MPTCLCIVYGCFPATTAEFSSCNRDSRAPKPKILPGPLQEKFADPRTIKYDKIKIHVSYKNFLLGTNRVSSLKA